MPTQAPPKDSPLSADAQWERRNGAPEPTPEPEPQDRPEFELPPALVPLGATPTVPTAAAVKPAAPVATRQPAAVEDPWKPATPTATTPTVNEPDADDPWAPRTPDARHEPADDTESLSIMDPAAAASEVRRVSQPRSRMQKPSMPRIDLDARKLTVWAVFGVFAVIMLLIVFMILGSLFDGGGSSATASEESDAAMSQVSFVGQTFPASETAGPQELSETRASGWSHTATGAALAAAYLSAGTTAQVSPSVFEPTINEQATGDGAAGMLQVRQGEYTQWAEHTKTPAGEPIKMTGAATLAGWRAPGFTETGPVQVHLLAQRPNKQFFEYAATVVWDDQTGDYKLLAPANGKFSSVDVADTSAYTLFFPSS